MMNEQTSQPSKMVENKGQNNGFLQRNKLTVKVIVIGILMLLLLIPISMISSLIHERESTAESAIQEVQDKWSNAQTLVGPVLVIPYTRNDKAKSLGRKYILPEDLRIEGNVQTEVLKRGIYEIVVYNSPLKISGKFVIPDEFKNMDVNTIFTNNISFDLGLSDLKGINELVKVNWGGETLSLNPGVSNKLFDTGLSSKINIASLKNEGGVIAFSISLDLKGSKALKFTPTGKTTSVHITSNCTTPSFKGTFLPDKREINDAGFTSSWKVLYLNRNYGQFIDSDQNVDLSESSFGVDLRIPVQQYQQSIRSVKYAFLIIILTFVISFFVEIKQKKNIHPFQYLLTGLALCMFYSLLISLSEHIGFGMAYLTAAIMTVLLLTFYFMGVLKIKKTALTIGALLTVLYTYIYVLIQLETYALIAGSIGLFLILAIIMYYSQKINWSK